MRLSHRLLKPRDKGFQTFEYVASIEYSTGETSSNLIEKYLEIRNWCWETFGPSCERDYYISLKRKNMEVNEHWAWHTDHFGMSIYFVSDAGLGWMLLKFQDMANA